MAGLSDRALADQVLRMDAPQQSINQTARAVRRKIVRRIRPDGRIGNFLATAYFVSPNGSVAVNPPTAVATILSEDEVKHAVQSWLQNLGWNVRTVWGRERGIDIEVIRDGQCRAIEVKGGGTRPDADELSPQHAGRASSTNGRPASSVQYRSLRNE